MVTALGWLVATMASIYIATCGYMAVMQRKFLYFPDPVLVSPAQANLPRAQSIGIVTSDGEHLVAWFIPPRDNEPLIIYFHGNGGNLAAKAPVFAGLTARGAGLLAIDYRGYGGSTGIPTEAGLHRDADAAYAKARALGYPPDRIFLMGESLGTGVTVALGAKAPVRGIILEASYSSVAAVAASRYWMLPVHMLMMDSFHADQAIAAIHVPLLFLHGENDGIIPIRFAKNLFERANEPKTFVTVDHGNHLVALVPKIMPYVLDWIDRVAKKPLTAARY